MVVVGVWVWVGWPLAGTAQHANPFVHAPCLSPPPSVPRSVPPDTLAAIFAQENQHKVIRSHHIHKAAMPVYCNR